MEGVIEDIEERRAGNHPGPQALEMSGKDLAIDKDEIPAFERCGQMD